jgi:hypothetical protein
MSTSITDRLRFKDSRLGYVKVDDGSIIILRVAIVDVRAREEASHFGVEFDVNATGGIAVYPSGAALKEVKDKPTVEPGKTVNEGWAQVDIVEKTPAYEEAVYYKENGSRYLIRVEIEPIMVSKNTLYKTPQGTPLYVVRWVPKITWNEVEDESIHE